MTSFTQTFGNSAVSPSYVAYAAYSFGSNLTLYWPEFSYGQANIAARFMSLTAITTGLNVFLPDATLVSTGYDVLVFNAGSNTLNVVNFSGGAIATIAAGQTYYILNTGNSTQSGTWQTVQFGVGTGSASAAALAGAGLLASAGLLNLNIPPSVVSTSYSITTAARATLQVWTGGSGVITLPTAASVGSGFIFALANDGSGSVTVATSGSDQIDGAPTSVFVQTQSGYIISSGTAWYTIGKGIANTFAVTLLNLNVAGSADVAETSAQAQNIIQQFTGLLTGNINIIMPNTVQIYFIYNNTTGPFTLTVKTAAGTGIQVAQGTNTILYCDGTNIVSGFTAVIGNSLTLPIGSASAPTLNFQSDTTTGLFSSGSHHVSVTSQGTEVADFSSPASAVNYLTFQSSATTAPVTIAAAGTDTNIGINITPLGTGITTIGAANLTGLPTATTAASSDNSTRIATTAFVKTQTSSSSFTGHSVTGTNTIAIGSTTPTNWTLTDGNLITFTPVNLNTGNVTLNVLGTGALPLYKISFAGIVNLAASDANPLLPFIAQYNATGNYYLVLNLIAYGSVLEVSTTQSVTSANTYDTYVATAPVTLNIAQSVLLPTYFYINILANGGAVTIGINGSDKLNNGTAGVGLTMPMGSSGTLYTDSNGNLWLTGTAATISSLLSSNNTWTGTQSFNTNQLVGNNLLLNGSSSGQTTLQSTAIAAGTLTLPAVTDTIAVLGTAQTWTAAQTFTNSDIKLLGSSTGATTFTSGNSGASNFTLTFPAATDQLVGRATTDTLTNKTYNTAGAGNVFQINGTGITAISGNAGTVATTTGTLTSAHLAKFDANGNIIDGGAVPSGSEVVLLATLTASTSTSLDFTSLITSAYDYYFFNIIDLLPGANTVTLNMLTSSNNGSSFDTTGYLWGVASGVNLSAGAAITATYSSSDTKIPLNGSSASFGTTNTNQYSGRVELFAPNSTLANKYIKSSIKFLMSSGTAYASVNLDAIRNSTSVINAVRFIFSSGNITSGSIQLYGYKNT